MERVSGSVPFYLFGNDLSFPFYRWVVMGWVVMGWVGLVIFVILFNFCYQR